MEAESSEPHVAQIGVENVALDLLDLFGREARGSGTRTALPVIELAAKATPPPGVESRLREINEPQNPCQGNASSCEVDGSEQVGFVPGGWNPVVAEPGLERTEDDEKHRGQRKVKCSSSPELCVLGLKGPEPVLSGRVRYNRTTPSADPSPSGGGGYAEVGEQPRVASGDDGLADPVIVVLAGLGTHARAEAVRGRAPQQILQ